RLTLDYTNPTSLARIKNLFQRMVTWSARQALRWLRLENVEALGPAHALLRGALAQPADLTILHTEIPLWTAAKLTRAGRAVAADFEDWYSEDLLSADRCARPLKLLRAAEKFALRHARYVSTTSQSMAGALVAAFDCAPPVVLRNVFPLQTSSHLDRPASNEMPAFVWFSQTIGPGRGLELFLAAWSRTTTRSRVVLIGDERPDYKEKLLRLLPSERRGLVNFLPFISPEKLPDKLTEFDIGLALEPNWPRNKDLTISNKIFQYLNAGLAIAATDTTGQSEVLRAAPESGLLIAAHDAGLLATQLDQLLSDANRLRAMQGAARRAAEQIFCWEREAPRLLEAVEHALARTSSTASDRS
ncbi:MAG: glycosyltransferase, partial [Verrucomicrobiota bacterium]|nr:glycosyltransferase [Verrucomicrobiota bacterium]